MGKANALKAKAAETAAAAGAGNLQVSQPRLLRTLYYSRLQGQTFSLGGLSFRFELLDLSPENHIWGCFKVKLVLS